MIQITGIPQVIKNFQEYEGRVLKAVIDAVQISQARIVNEARLNHPYRDRTGNLTNSIQPGDVIVSEEGVTAFVEARMQYATFVEFGTSRARAYPFLTPAILREYPFYKQSIEREIRRIKL